MKAVGKAFVLTFATGWIYISCMCAGSRYQAINIFWNDEKWEEANRRREEREKEG